MKAGVLAVGAAGAADAGAADDAGTAEAVVRVGAGAPSNGETWGAIEVASMVDPTSVVVTAEVVVVAAELVDSLSVVVSAAVVTLRESEALIEDESEDDSCDSNAEAEPESLADDESTTDWLSEADTDSLADAESTTD